MSGSSCTMSCKEKRAEALKALTEPGVKDALRAKMRREIKARAMREDRILRHARENGEDDVLARFIELGR